MSGETKGEIKNMGRENQNRVNSKQTTLYGIVVFAMVLFVCIAYARVTTELQVEGEAEGVEQEGIYITEVAYLSNNGADTTNSKVNFFLGTMLDSNVTLGSSSSSTITYKVTVKNNTTREQVFIGIVKDETNGTIYSNTNIQPNVATAGGITGLEQYVTTIAPGETLTFPVTFAYSGTDTSNTKLQSKINFRFREKPVLELSNNGETYTWENIKVGDVKEYTFTVSNYNETYNNGVPLTYTLVPTLTEGSPLTAKIYDANGAEVTGAISIAGDNTQVDQKYTLKIEWDSSLDSTEYEGKNYTCEVKLTAIPDTTVNADLDDYADYKIEQGFNVEITTCSHTWQSGVCTICGKVCNHTFGAWTTVTAATCGAEGLEARTCSICGLQETQIIEPTGNHTFGAWTTVTAPTCTAQGTNKRTCTVCGAEETAPVDALGHKWVNGVCSRCGLKCEHNFVDGTCTTCGEKEIEAIPNSTEYVGCYADMDANGTVDGVIFADHGYGMVGTSPWGDSWGPYSVTKITSGLKEYYISQESYTNSNWGTHEVISPVEGTSGTDRFYVMALSDISTSTYTWYSAASGNLDSSRNVATSANDFGSGKSNTIFMVSAINAGTYGTGTSTDMWKVIQNNSTYPLATSTSDSGKWFVPSKGEWSAFGGELGITSSNYSSTYGLSYYYWSSSQSETYTAFRTRFDGGFVGRRIVHDFNYVRLCATF